MHLVASIYVYVLVRFDQVMINPVCLAIINYLEHGLIQRGWPSGPIASRERSVRPFVKYADKKIKKFSWSPTTPPDGIFWIRACRKSWLLCKFSSLTFNSTNEKNRRWSDCACAMCNGWTAPLIFVWHKSDF